jgi:hypothetical protein
MALKSVDKITFMSPNLDHLVIRASSESKAGHFYDTSDDVVMGLEFLVLEIVSHMPDV